MMTDSATLAVTILALGVLIVAAHGQGPEPEFKPAFVGIEFTSQEVLPGDEVAYTLKFRNEGTKPAAADHTVFVHFEGPEASCENIVVHADHLPTRPTTLWQPGEVVTDGPHVIRAPNHPPEQELHVHIGVYTPMFGGERLLERYVAKLKVTRSAPPSSEWQPEPLARAEVEKRRAALRERLKRPVALETAAWKFELDQDSGAFLLTDKQTDVVWSSNPNRPRWGEVGLQSDERRATVPLERFDAVRREGERLVAEVDLQVDGKPARVKLSVIVEPTADAKGLRISRDWEASGPWQLASLTALDHALFTTDADEGYTIVPRRLGLLLPTDRGLPATRRYMTYSGATMAMCGAVKQGSALLVAWRDPDTELLAHTSVEDSPLVGGRRTQSVSLILGAYGREFEVYPLGRGGYVEVAAAYRPVAERRGWRQTWAQKRERCEWADQMAGAADFKPFVLSRTLANTRFNASDEDRVGMGYTFDEVARCAEHWKNDLGIDRAMVVLAGWIHRGYDNQHPDILPACPECGGNEGLADCARRVKACGYLFGLHDNYQDMYRDAPSWDEKQLNKRADGVVKKGGEWAGGQAYQVCAIEQVNLARRNLPQVKALCDPTIYFIDTTFAWGLVTCEDPAHPMARADDLGHKTELCRVAQKHFGLFGSEEGREWAVPCAEYLEGLLSHKTRPEAGEIVVPIFPLVYGDCINLYTHQGDRIGPSDAKKVIDHILYAEMSLPSFGGHLYFTQDAPSQVRARPEVSQFEQVGPRKFRLTYRWHVTGPIGQDLRCFVHFTHPQADRPEKISLQDDHVLEPPTSQWRAGQTVEIGPHEVEIPEGLTGEWDLLIGVLADGRRLSIAGLAGRGGRHKIGVVKLEGDKIEFEPVQWSGAMQCFSQGDDGWARDLNLTDRTIKNTYEVLSYLNRLTADTPMTGHEFVTEDRSVERTRFGDVTIAVNYGETPFEAEGATLPQFGFLVDSPTFVAFHATRYQGIDYDGGALFTLRSLDDKPLAESERVRIFHGFGPSQVKLAGKTVEVEREEVVTR